MPPPRLAAADSGSIGSRPISAAWRIMGNWAQAFSPIVMLYAVPQARSQIVGNDLSVGGADPGRFLVAQYAEPARGESTELPGHEIHDLQFARREVRFQPIQVEPFRQGEAG